MQRHAGGLHQGAPLHFRRRWRIACRAEGGFRFRRFDHARTCATLVRQKACRRSKRVERSPAVPRPAGDQLTAALHLRAMKFRPVVTRPLPSLSRPSCETLRWKQRTGTCARRSPVWKGMPALFYVRRTRRCQPRPSAARSRASSSVLSPSARLGHHR